MTQVMALWQGGCSYADSDPERDLERFPSIAAAVRALRERESRGYGYKQDFDFVNVDPESVFTPCSDRSSRILVWQGWETVEGKVYVPETPDREIRFGKRGGIVVESC